MQTLSTQEFTHEEIVARLVEGVESGIVAAVPTDTVYGLVCDARNEEAIGRLIAMKERPEEKPLGIFVRDVEMALEYADIEQEQKEMLRTYWPGATTFIVNTAEEFALPGQLTKDGTVGMRQPDDQLLIDVMHALGAPLAQSSANKAGDDPAQSTEAVRRVFDNGEAAPDVLIDGGELEDVPASSVLDIRELPPTILRE